MICFFIYLLFHDSQLLSFIVILLTFIVSVKLNDNQMTIK